MLASRRGFAIAGTTGSALAMLAACSNSRSRGDTQPSASAPPSNQQKGAPYPADMAHLDQILAIGNGHVLPEGARVAYVSPAIRFAEKFSGGWGYVIAFTATDPAIRQYVTKYTIFSGDNLEVYETSESGDTQTADLNFAEMSSPWTTGTADGVLVLERPLGRGWLIIAGSSR